MPPCAIVKGVHLWLAADREVCEGLRNEGACYTGGNKGNNGNNW